MAVLFFASFDEMNKQCHSYRKNMSLPSTCSTLLARRAHPCTSSLPASMTVEAALVLPLALFFFLALLQPVIWLDRQRKVQICHGADWRGDQSIWDFGGVDGKPETVSCRHSVRTLRQLFGSGEESGSTRIM